MKAIVPAAKRQGVKRIVCDHPFFARFTLAEQAELAEQGVWINFTVGELLPRWWRVSVSDFAAAIRNVGVGRALISSDCGQLHNPPMVEAMRVACQLLLEEEFSIDDIKALLHRNPAKLIYP
jgi:predicted metal-dependent TIM-barrel fold hydrolase